MKKIFLIIFALFTHFTIAQTKYSSLSDACTRNSNNATTNNSKGIYITNVAVNEYAFLDNQSTNFKRLPRGYYYHVASNTAIQTNLRGKITNTQACPNVPSGNWQIQNTYTSGLSGDNSYQTDNTGNMWYYPPTGEYYSQMSIQPLSNNKVSIQVDTRGWGNGIGTLKFKLDVSPIWYTKQELESFDFTNQKGRDISIIGALFDSNGYIQDSRQTIVHFSGDSNSDIPSFFKRPSNKRIGSPSYFPNFNVLTGKKNIINYGSLSSNFQFENHQYLSKGFNYVTKKGNPAISNNVSMLSEYDTWATDNGCPASTGGSNRQAEAVQWLANTPMSQLYQYYLPVISAGSSHGVMFHDFEAFGYVLLGNQTACNKLATLHRAFKLANPNCLMTSYINARPIEVNYGTDISNAQVSAENNKYNLPFASLATGFYAKQVQYLDINTGNPTGLTGYMSDNLGLGIVGDYLHRYNDNNFYAFVQEMELAKKHLPNQNLVSLFWSYIETLPSQDTRDINSIRRYYRKGNGFVYMTDYKLAVPFCEMYNRSLWPNFIVEGQWLWHDPNNAVDGYDYHGGNAKDVLTEQYIKDNAPNQFYSISTLGSMEISTTIGYDYSQLALYELSLNSDILPNQTLSCDFSLDNGNSYFTGEDLKPASAEFKRLPLVRYKISGNNALVLAYNKHLQSFETQTVKIRINGKTTDIKLNGQFSTLKRIRLN